MVGWSKHIGYRIVAGSNGVADSTAQCDDVQVVPPGTTGLDYYDVVVDQGPNGVINTTRGGDDKWQSYGVNGSEKRAFVCFISDSYDLFDMIVEMRELKSYLEGLDLDLTGWELTEAKGVSDDGTVICGNGTYDADGPGGNDPVEMGWVAVIPPYGCETVPTIASISPDNARTGDLLDDALVQGSGFVVGQTDVKLTKAGESDIVATDVTVAGDGNSLTCDFNLIGAAGGDWTWW